MPSNGRSSAGAGEPTPRAGLEGSSYRPEVAGDNPHNASADATKVLVRPISAAKRQAPRRQKRLGEIPRLASIRLRSGHALKSCPFKAKGAFGVIGCRFCGVRHVARCECRLCGVVEILVAGVGSCLRRGWPRICETLSMIREAGHTRWVAVAIPFGGSFSGV